MYMTMDKLVKAMEAVKTYCSAPMLDELDYVIELLKKMKSEGIEDPMKIDYSKLIENK